MSGGRTRTGAPAGAECWLLLMLAVLSPWAAAGTDTTSGSADSGFEVTALELRREGERYFANLEVDFAFSQEALDAMQSGVDLFLTVRVRVEQQRWWLDRTINEHAVWLHLQHNPLSGTFVVRRLDTGEFASFEDAGELRAGLGAIHDVPLGRRADYDADERYRLESRATIEIESLPLPMRPLAYLSSAWRLSSEWRTWPFTP